MTSRIRAIASGGVLALVLVCGLAAPGRAQEAPLDREHLTRYARVHIAMDVARDEFHAKIAGIHDDVGLARARQEMDARIAEILTEHGMTMARYAEITLLVSQDEAVRSVFEEISRRLREEPDEGPS